LLFPFYPEEVKNPALLLITEGATMEIKSFLAGLLVAYGIANIIMVFNIPFTIALKIYIFDFNFGNMLLALIAFAVSYYLLKG
jgi:hypothetical protein